MRNNRALWSPTHIDARLPIPKELRVPSPPAKSKRGFFRIMFGRPFGAPQAPGKRLGLDMGLDLAWLCARNDPDEMRIPFFVFGKDNNDRLVDMGLRTVLLDRRPTVSCNSLPYSMFVHKFLAFEAAMGQYDEAVYLDVDCERVKPLPEDFWESHGRKSVLQTALFRYRGGTTRSSGATGAIPSRAWLAATSTCAASP